MLAPVILTELSTHEKPPSPSEFTAEDHVSPMGAPAPLAGWDRSVPSRSAGPERSWRKLHALQTIQTMTSFGPNYAKIASMPHETEIKLKLLDLKSFHRHLKRLGAQPLFPGSGRIHEMNLLFDTPQGGLAKHGQLLRIRTEIPAAGAGKGAPRGKKKPQERFLLTFKSPPDQLAIGPATVSQPSHGRYKIREEIEMVISDAGALEKIFEGLGLRGWFRYEKYRTTYHLPARHHWAQDLLIEVDETPLGDFVELEGPAVAIDQAAKELGFSPGDYILKNYLVLYLDDCRRRNLPPGDMLFPPSRR